MKTKMKNSGSKYVITSRDSGLTCEQLLKAVEEGGTFRIDLKRRKDHFKVRYKGFRGTLSIQDGEKVFKRRFTKDGGNVIMKTNNITIKVGSVVQDIYTERL